MIALLSVFTAVLASFIYFIIAYKHSRGFKISNIAELFCLFENNKILPVGAKTRWDLVEVLNGVRVWRKTLNGPASIRSMGVVGAYAQIKISPKILTSILTSSKTQKHWNAYLPKNSVIKTFPLNPTVFEREAMYIETKETQIAKVAFQVCARFLNKSLSKERRINCIRNDLIRCWRLREEGGLWLVEHSLDFSKWLFYLVTALPDEPDSSTITVITASYFLPSFTDLITTSSLSTIDPTTIIIGLKDFIETKTFPHIASLSLTNISNSSKCTPPSKEESSAIELIKSDHSILSAEKEDISLFQRFKNLLDEKKEEQNKSKKPVTDFMSPMDVIKRLSVTGRLFEEKKPEIDKRGSLPAVPASSSGSPSRWDSITKVVNKENRNIKTLHKTSNTAGEKSRLARYLDSIIDSTAEEIINEKSKVTSLDIKASVEEQAIQTGGWIYCGLEKDTVILKKNRSATQPYHTYMSKGLLPCPPKLVYEVLRKSQNRMSYDDVIKKVEVLEELGSDVKIVLLQYEVGQNFKREKRELVVVQGERMEGLKHVITMVSVDWPDVKAQYKRSNYDEHRERDSADVDCDDDEDEDEEKGGSEDEIDDNDGNCRSKKVSNVKVDSKDVGKIKDGMVGDDAVNRKREMQKRNEKDIHSNDISSGKIPVNDGVVIDKMGASGWIVEPFMKGDNLCAMVTYICQLSFKESTTMDKSLSQMAVDIALKQPLCLKHLRNYMASLAIIQSRGDPKEDSKKNVTLSLSNALAKFRNVETVAEEEYDGGDGARDGEPKNRWAA